MWVSDVHSERPRARPAYSWLQHCLCALLRRSTHSGCSSASSQHSSATAAARRLDFAGDRMLRANGHAEDSNSSAAVRLGRSPADGPMRMAAQSDMHPDGCSSATSPAQQSDGAETTAVVGHSNARSGRADGSELPSPQLPEHSTYNGPVTSGSAGRYTAAGNGMQESTEFSRTAASPPGSTTMAPAWSESTAANVTGQEPQPGPLQHMKTACLT